MKPAVNERLLNYLLRHYLTLCSGIRLNFFLCTFCMFDICVGNLLSRFFGMSSRKKQIYCLLSLRTLLQIQFTQELVK
jgi:hypothetical protein